MWPVLQWCHLSHDTGRVHLKRSNRLVLLIGVFLAIVAFVGIVVLAGGSNTGSGPGTAQAPTSLPTVYATVDIPLGTIVTATMIQQTDTPITQRDASAFNSTTLVVGKIARADIVKGAQLTAADFAGTRTGLTNVNVPTGLRAMAVQVDQVSGVGTIINTGDYVDVLVGITGDKFPVVASQTGTSGATSSTPTVVSGLNGTSVKLLLQSVQVIGTLLPPVAATTSGAGTGAAGNNGTTSGTGTGTGAAPTSLNGQQEIVILAVTPQQSEVIKFSQMDGNITLVLRSAKDFVKNGQPIVPLPATTTGIILKVLVDQYNVLTPQLVETILPKK